MRVLGRLLLAAVLTIVARGHVRADEPVAFPAAEAGVTLRAHLALPAVASSLPAVVFLHGCSGLGRSGGVFSIYRAWAAHLTAAGFAVLMVDSAGSRGLGATCGAVEGRRRMYRERPGDAYAALAYLQSLPAVDPDRIGLIGWSQGGGIALLTIVSESIGRPVPPPVHEFRAAVALYPAACSERAQSAPFTRVERGSWTPVAPLLVLQGGADNWTRPEPCEAFVGSLKARGLPVDIVVYPGAVHAFDAPGMPVHERPGPLTAAGVPPLIGTDETARRDAFARVLHFLRAELGG